MRTGYAMDPEIRRQVRVASVHAAERRTVEIGKVAEGGVTGPPADRHDAAIQHLRDIMRFLASSV
jgi:hypothetical protein